MVLWAQNCLLCTSCLLHFNIRGGGTSGAVAEARWWLRPTLAQPRLHNVRTFYSMQLDSAATLTNSSLSLPILGLCQPELHALMRVFETFTLLYEYAYQHLAVYVMMSAHQSVMHVCEVCVKLFAAVYDRHAVFAIEVDLRYAA